MQPKYLRLSIGAPARLAALREAFAKRSPHSNATTWRDVRHDTFANPYPGLGQRFNGEGRNRVPVWYSHNGPEFRDEWKAEELLNLRHRGYYTDGEDCHETAHGIVASLPHGRFIAGYFLSVNDERVYFGDVFDFTDYEDIAEAKRDAARMADEHARIIGEQESEHADRWQEARAIESDIEESLQRLRECLALRHAPYASCFSYVRTEARTLMRAIRKARESLAADFADVME